MNNQFFILSDEVYNNGLFPQIPNHSKKDSWFILTEGTSSDIIVDDRTTVKQIRKGRYKRLVEVSRKSHTYIHTFNSSCKEKSYTFKVTVKAYVLVENPLDFYSNIRSVNIQDFFNNQFSLDVRKITKNYSILNYDGIDDDLSDILPRTKVYDSTNGLAYQIQTVETEPNEAALKIIKDKEQMGINNYLKKQEMVGRADISNFSDMLSGGDLDKAYEQALWGEVTGGKLSDVQAIEKIGGRGKQSRKELLQDMLELRNEGIITDDDMDNYKQALLPTMPKNIQKLAAIPQRKGNPSLIDADVDDLFEED